MDIALGFTAVLLFAFWLIPGFQSWVRWKLERPPEWMNTIAIAWLLAASPWFFYRPLQILVLILLIMVICLL